MRRIMLRVEDDLHRRITDAAHDARLSTNRWLTRMVERAVTPVNSAPPARTNHQHEQWQIQESPLGPYCTACGRLIADDATREKDEK